MDKEPKTLSKRGGIILLIVCVILTISICMGITSCNNNLNQKYNSNIKQNEDYTTDTLKRASGKIQSGQSLSPDEQRTWDSYQKWEGEQYDQKQREKYNK